MDMAAVSPSSLLTFEMFIRRERNRIHAKMTRDRKKMFMANIEQTIVQLEEENKKMRDSLAAHIAAAALSESSIRSLIAETASN